MTATHIHAMRGTNQGCMGTNGKCCFRLLVNGLLMFDGENCLALLAQPLGATFPGCLVLDTTSLHLVGENLCAVLLGFGFVDVLHEHTLVLEYVTLRFLVKGVVKMLVDFPRLSVLSQQPSQDSLSPHPLHLRRQPRLSRTLPLTRARMSALSFGSMEVACACARVDDRGLDNHAALLDELLDVRTGVGVSDFSLFCGVEPDFAFTDARDGGCEPFLGA